MDSKNLFTLSHPYGKVDMAVASEGCIELLKMQGIDIPDSVEPIKNMEDVINNPYEGIDSTKYGVALYVTPYCEPVVCYLPYEQGEDGLNIPLEPFRQAVDGYIERVTTVSKTNFDIFCNEEGIMGGMAVNRPLYYDGMLYDACKGNMIITGADYSVGTSLGLSPEQLKEAWEMYKLPCVVCLNQDSKDGFEKFSVFKYVNNKQNREFLTELFEQIKDNPKAMIFSKKAVKQAEMIFGARQVGSINFNTQNKENNGYER